MLVWGQPLGGPQKPLLQLRHQGEGEGGQTLGQLKGWGGVGVHGGAWVSPPTATGGAGGAP